MNGLIERYAPSITARVAAWAVLGFVAYLVVGVGSLFAVALMEGAVLDPIGLGGEPGTSSWGVVLAAHPVVWGVATAAIATWLARRLLPGAVRVGLSSTIQLACALALAAITTYLLHEFVRARYGWFDAEYAGLSIFAPSTLVAIGLAGWAAAALPLERRKPLIVAHLAAVAALGLALLPSLPGVQDGIRTSSIPLATILAVDVAFAVTSASWSLVRRRAG